ncbi:hypothetical protein CIG2463D_1048 [Campylobacter iguaniorum]|uniref:hypothetical protein n=1 Tax=Campylobacter iguaniorum TaxID=1244531 RepID=UPI00073A36C8|nr:hypothetical protein [Campylobacter iguaniorum]ALV24620.1 hypothetical protein CIG2463D_1048 [Campylobacter iguaniorum]
MKFIASFVVFFTFLYGLIALHYVSFDRTNKNAKIDELAKNIKDPRLSTTFISKDYKRFVYDK